MHTIQFASFSFFSLDFIQHGFTTDDGDKDQEHIHTYTQIHSQSNTSITLTNEVYFLRYFFTNGDKKPKKKNLLSFTIYFHREFRRVKKITGNRFFFHNDASNRVEKFNQNHIDFIIHQQSSNPVDNYQSNLGEKKHNTVLLNGINRTQI